MTAVDDLTLSVAQDTGLTETQVRDVLEALTHHYAETFDWLRYAGMLKRTRYMLRFVPRDPRKDWWEAGYEPPVTELVESPDGDVPLWTVHQ